MNISIIVAMAKNRAIGKNNDLPWRIKDDMKIFRQTTLNHVVMMGRKSMESMGNRPLKHRTNLVITRSNTYNPEGVIICNSFESAISLAKDLDEKELFVLGGGEVYAQLIDKCNKMYISHIQTDIVDADVYFPEVDWSKWEQISRESFEQNERNEFPFDFTIYERK
ncbi:MAG: hypothetical protein CNE98_06685 [Bacteroidetes bacterium MED-G17]|jgi:dihydrofolate reductase|nr:MAG: hypothetical protein CBB99_06710 [Bacteroidetes bacterium TMED39]PDH51727.1 MAG: hypothetical protein CNE98_06685 [Bacteroidetes bacterium MED-G17]CAI8342017.1 MAG: Dihydrofolate reductase [Bacteroidetes bacterium MED-G17]|tara:strand:- start:36439 stop:36936 length:498 start_codon:yes stop_codon:yes gene_type:complete